VGEPLDLLAQLAEFAATAWPTLTVAVAASAFLLLPFELFAHFPGHVFQSFGWLV
jgi:hypothetical protein